MDDWRSSRYGSNRASRCTWGLNSGISSSVTSPCRHISMRQTEEHDRQAPRSAWLSHRPFVPMWPRVSILWMPAPRCDETLKPWPGIRIEATVTG